MKVELSKEDIELIHILLDGEYADPSPEMTAQQNRTLNSLNKRFSNLQWGPLEKENLNRGITKSSGVKPIDNNKKLKESVKDSIRKLSMTEEAGQDFAKAKAAELMKKGIKPTVKFDTVTWEENGKIYTFSGKTNKTLVKDKVGGSFVGGKKTSEEEMGGSFEKIAR